jgi:transcriptional antiterminator NusG
MVEEISMTETQTDKRWYVVHAYSGFEKSVAQALRDRIVRMEMQDRFGDVLVPTEEVIEMRAGQKRRSERKFFPGYVLVQIATHDEGGIPRIDNESWHLVKETPKVMGFIGGTADRPLPIRDAEADMILQRVQEASRSRSRRCCSSRARWFAWSTARSTTSMAWSRRVNYDKSRLRVAVLIFGRSTPVELEFGQVEKA